MEKLRVRYTKAGKAAYISHLDLMTTMQRALLRAGVSLKYSDGFNPHPYISIALPLQVGSESSCELMDIALRGGGIQDKVNTFMPEGLRIQKAYRGYRGFGDIKWVAVQCKILSNNINRDAKSGAGINFPDNLADHLADCFALKQLVISKKTKRGISEIDVIPHIRNASVKRAADEHGNDCIIIEALISAQNPTISSKDFAAIAERAAGALNPGMINPENGSGFAAPGNVIINRIDIYDENMVLFR